MNLRILKKLSKRAAALLPLLGDDRKQFSAEADDNYHGAVISDRKHWERSPCHPTFEGWGDDIVRTTRAGRSLVMRPPRHPRKGTIMVGAVSGYYEPEWDETDAWTSLRNLVAVHFTDWSVETPTLERPLRTVAEVFQAAAAMAAELASA